MSDPSSTPETLADLLPTTPDVRAERLAELKRLFPDLFTNEGRLNPDELRQLVEPNEVHETERYEFKWYGKAASKREAFTPTTATLVYDESRSVNPEKADGNMIIEGENLETLKLLLNAYREQVKCIYIDPPYNTGKDFIYRDNYRKDKASYWEESGATENGTALHSNPETSGRYHSDWLSMMHARLLVARSLLKPEGVMFISIDDNEAQNMRRLLDEVFGEENFVAQFVWQKRVSPDNDEKHVTPTHEYVLCYMKTRHEFQIKGFKRSAIQDDRYENADNDDRGPWTSSDLTRREYRERDFYEIELPSGRKVRPAAGRSWSVPPESFEKLRSENRVWFGPNGDAMPRLKRFLSDVSDKVVPVTWLGREQVGTNQDGKRAVNAIFPELSDVFNNPKPSRLIETLINMTTDPNDLVLDFFGGSGTTAQAVIEVNKGDDGKRCAIVVQLPEITDTNSPAHKGGFTKISDITIERIKRFILTEQKLITDLLPSDPKKQLLENAGFKVYKLQKSNFPRCEFKPDPSGDEETNVAALRRYIDEKEAAFFLTLDEQGEQAVFDEVLLKNGFQLHYTRTRREDFTENTVFEVRDPRRTALVCLAWNESIKEATIKRLREIADAGEAPFFICLERSLSTTSKWNLRHFLGKQFNAF